MTLLLDNRSGQQLDERKVELMEKAALSALEYENFDTKCEISLSVVNNSEIKEINGQFRGIDRETDVLSFPQLTFAQGEYIARNEKEEIILGDIIISLEKAEAQAVEYGHSLERELCFLVVHSMLHLLGYDHINSDEEKVMFQKQEEILCGMGLQR